jgi:hypothetical protein
LLHALRNPWRYIHHHRIRRHDDFLTVNINGYMDRLQIIPSIGGGMNIQIPILAVQANSSRDQISVISARLIFFQNLGGAIFLAVSKIAFNTELPKALAKYALGIDSEVVITVGVRGVRSVVPDNLLPSVLIAYSKLPTTPAMLLLERL